MKSLHVFCFVLLGLAFTAPPPASAAFIAATDGLGNEIPLTPINAIPGGALVIGDKRFSNFDLDGFGGVIPPTPSMLLVQAGTDSDTGQYGLRFRMAFAATAGQLMDALLSFQVSVIPANSNMRITGTTMTLSAPTVGAGGFVAIGEDIYGTSSTAIAPVAHLEVSATPGGNPADQSDTVSFLSTPLQTAYIRKDIILFGGTSGVTHMSEFFQYYQQTEINTIPEPSLVGLGIVSGLGSCWLIRRKKRASSF